MDKLKIEIKQCNSLCLVNLLADDVRFHSQYGWGNDYKEEMEQRRAEIKLEAARRGRFNPAGRNPWR
jgi:hypothetical protein